MKIRTASTETDLPAIARLINPFETEPITAERVRAWFQYNPPGLVQLRLVSVDEKDNVTGYSCILHNAQSPAGHFYTWLGVNPTCRRQGTGAALWAAALEFLRQYGANHLTSEVQDNDPVGLAFAERRGFAVNRHLFHSSLDLTSFDETPYLPAIAALEAAGIRFCALADFPDTPETRRKLYELNSTNVLDIPGTDRNPWTFSSFEETVISAPWFNPAGQLLAVDGDTWVGLAAVSLYPETQGAYNLHTGVLRDYRGRKIAQSLKVLAARYARQHGAQQISTDNDSLNAPILAVNRKMGYQPQTGKYLLISRPG